MRSKSILGTINCPVYYAIAVMLLQWSEDFRTAVGNTELVEEESYVVPIDSKKWNKSKTFDNCIWVDIFKNTGAADDNKRFSFISKQKCWVDN